MLTARRSDRPSARRRILSFALALAVEVLLVLAFLSLDFRSERKAEFKGGALSTFDLSSDDETPASSAQKQTAAAKPPRPTPPVPTPPRPLPDRPLPLLVLNKQEFAAADIANLGTAAAQPDSGAQVAQGHSAGDSARIGTAPNGEPLYAAEWYREPTRQEIAGYLPKTMPDGGGSGLVACKTAERFHVEDCVELGSDPPGSRLAGAVRQAAWQFLVRPPRVGGKVLVGTWVRIRIDYLP